MRKTQELNDPLSCFNRAGNDEMLFVLLGRDPAAPFAIRQWIEERIRLGKNKRTDSQIQEAEECASTMEPEPVEPKVDQTWKSTKFGTLCIIENIYDRRDETMVVFSWEGTAPREVLVRPLTTFYREFVPCESDPSPSEPG